jgi:hypothetical protein
VPEQTEQAEGPDRPTEDDERTLEELIGRLKALLNSPLRCREYYFAYLGAHSAACFLSFARRLGRSPIRPGEFPEFSDTGAPSR